MTSSSGHGQQRLINLECQQAAAHKPRLLKQTHQLNMAALRSVLIHTDQSKALPIYSASLPCWLNSHWLVHLETYTQSICSSGDLQKVAVSAILDCHQQTASANLASNDPSILAPTYHQVLADILHQSLPRFSSSFLNLHCNCMQNA